LHSTSPRGRGLTALLLLVLTLSSTACTRIDNALASVPIFAFLRNAPSFDPYEAPRGAPPGSVPFNAPNGVPDAPVAATDAAITAYGATLKNPMAADEAGLARGKLLFERHCLVCHGVQGAGDGPVIGPGKFPFATNLTLPATAARSDGYIYGMIRVGRGLMPAYGSRTSDVDRWQIVNYVRTLQRGAAATPGAAAAPAPAPAAQPQGR
jgi:mono/diheme cytochrome c family protein